MLYSQGLAFGESGVTIPVPPGRNYLPPFPLSAVWSINIESISTYGTVWWYALQTGSFTGADYYGPSYGPFGGGTKRFAISTDGTDTAASWELTFGKWYRQGFRATSSGGTHSFRYLPDLPSLASSNVISKSHTASLSNLSTTHIRLANTSWAPDEGLRGSIGFMKIWRASVSDEELRMEARSVDPVLSKYRGALWANWHLRTHRDLRDYSGKGRQLQYINGSSQVATRADAPVGIRVRAPRLYTNPAPNTDQSDFRFFNDDGVLAGA